MRFELDGFLIRMLIDAGAVPLNPMTYMWRETVRVRMGDVANISFVSLDEEVKHESEGTFENY